MDKLDTLYQIILWDHEVGGVFPIQLQEDHTQLLFS